MTSTATTDGSTLEMTSPTESAAPGANDGLVRPTEAAVAVAADEDVDRTAELPSCPAIPPTAPAIRAMAATPTVASRRRRPLTGSVGGTGGCWDPCSGGV